jgi:hypothetical protein
LEPEGTAVPLGVLIESADQHNLGNGFLDQTVIGKPTLFPAAMSEVDIRDVIPPEFRSVLPTFKRAFTLPGVITDPPVLALGELQRREEQLKVDEFRRSIETLTTTDLPITLTNFELTEKFGGGVLGVALTLDDASMTIDQGYLVTDAFMRQLHAPDPPNYPTGLFMKLTKELTPDTEWPPLTSRLWDPEFQNYKIEEEQVVLPSYVPTFGLTFVEQTKAIDRWRSQKIRTTRTPTHLSEATAIITYEYRPFQFPGTFDYQALLHFDHGEGFRKTSAQLCKHTIKTWWLSSVTTPTVGPTGSGADIEVDEIITDTVNIPVYTAGSTVESQRYSDVLHDEFTNTQGFYYAETTPSMTEYLYGSPSGTVSHVYASISANGSGYTVGNIITGGGASMQVDSIAAGGAIAAAHQTSPAYVAPPNNRVVSSTLVTASTTGGSGTGAALNVITVVFQLFVAGSSWVGNEKACMVKVSTTDLPQLWKVEKALVVMR